jgi:hypothetical protein
MPYQKELLSRHCEVEKECFYHDRGLTRVVFAQMFMFITPAGLSTQVAGVDRSSAMAEGCMCIGRSEVDSTIQISLL